MHIFDVLALLGIILISISILNLSIYLQPNRKSVRQFVSRNVKETIIYGLLISFIMLFQ
jgi:hypothetical protein